MRDLRSAFRTLRATPVASVIAALSLALGIGANTAIFSLVSSVMLRSLPGGFRGRQRNRFRCDSVRFPQTVSLCLTQRSRSLVCKHQTINQDQ
jgi:hypothetical protein